MGPLLSTYLGPFACLIAVDGPRCFYAYHFRRELVKTAPADAMFSNRQSINITVSSRPSPRLSCRAGGAAIAYPAASRFRLFLYNSGWLRN